MGFIIGALLAAIILTPIALWYLYQDIKGIKRYRKNLIQCPRCAFNYFDYLQKCPHCKKISDNDLDKARELKKMDTDKLKTLLYSGALFFLIVFVAGLLSL